MPDETPESRGSPAAEPSARARSERLDETSFHALYERMAPAILTWIHLRLGPAARARLEPEDLAQEVWLRALKAAPHFDKTRGSPRGWLFQITKYTLLDAFRTLSIGPNTTPAGGGSSRVSRSEMDLSQVPEAVSSLTRRVARAEGLQRLLQEVASLPSEERELLTICGLEGRPASEAATVLGIGHEAARKRWLRLRQRLAESPELAALIE